MLSQHFGEFFQINFSIVISVHLVNKFADVIMVQRLTKSLKYCDEFLYASLHDQEYHEFEDYNVHQQ